MEKYIKASMEVIEFGEDNILTESVVTPGFVEGNNLNENINNNDSQTWKNTWSYGA